jgi:hypothetical protein
VKPKRVELRQILTHSATNKHESNTGSFFIKQIKYKNRDIYKYLQIFSVLAAFFWVDYCVVRSANLVF